MILIRVDRSSKCKRINEIALFIVRLSDYSPGVPGETGDSVDVCAPGK